jgi:hypothetical protein
LNLLCFFILTLINIKDLVGLDIDESIDIIPFEHLFPLWVCTDYLHLIVHLPRIWFGSHWLNGFSLLVEIPLLRCSSIWSLDDHVVANQIKVSSWV